MNEVGTDLQLISPRPFHAMHSMKPSSIIHQWTNFVNDIIARQCKLYPDLFQGVAGLPQSMDEGVDRSVYELERCVKELGFVGCSIIPIPQKADTLRHRQWGTSTGIRCMRRWLN